ncbi:MAG: hypothetical protein VYD12_18020, partial [Pseudomonadota bacterium]|nr:hypothetical protein [Pseudomonadota bacterium]
MLASNRITLTVVMIFTGVFSVLSVVMFMQARADVQKEGRAAFSQAKTLAASDISLETLKLLLKSNRDLVLLSEPPTQHSVQETAFSLNRIFTPVPPQAVQHVLSGETLWIAANAD